VNSLAAVIHKINVKRPAVAKRLCNPDLNTWTTHISPRTSPSLKFDVLHVRKPKWLQVKILRRYTSEIKESKVAFITNNYRTTHHAMQRITNGSHHHVVQGFYQLRMAVEEPIIVQRLHA